MVLYDFAAHPTLLMVQIPFPSSPHVPNANPSPPAPLTPSDSVAAADLLSRTGRLIRDSPEAADLAIDTARPLLVARRMRRSDAPPGRPPALAVSYEGALLLTLTAVNLAASEIQRASLELDEIPSAEALATWESLARLLNVSSWQARRACTAAVEAGPQPPLPTGANFAQNRVARFGLVLMLHYGVYEPEELEPLLGLKPAVLDRVCLTDRAVLQRDWSVARGRTAAQVAKECRGKIHFLEVETAAKAIAVSEKRDSMTPSPWVAVCGTMRRIASTRQAYLSMPESGLEDGCAEQAARRLGLRHSALQQYIQTCTYSWSGHYAPLDLADMLSDANMKELRRSMAYGVETSLLQLRREVLFSRLGIIDRFVTSQLQNAPEIVTHPLEVDQQGEIPKHVEEAFAPLFEVCPGLANRSTGRPLDGRELFLSEVLTDRPWEARQALLRAAFDAALSPWSW